ncbi:ribonuclease P protein component [Hydrocarboniclastica marina]|uniref:Ribonuclease P protein component n=1 Tax=Hydrocarboniclastica marina TaxID=2259620 RepID=A0A4P7XCZ9_9ALTE|nr:ribonuclease P protein component [Hydrocarboniclastica marina]MAM00458.1 ribonuclease P protein component [Alteromonadaceae bacterium]QCF24475.1 ribonuclease P protein component [Hydrocarboniclastica marina]|tara:strand:+ start:2903 stop:3295 length:393 start_codon:yes stop_codon:yes gene_type:complete
MDHHDDFPRHWRLLTPKDYSAVFNGVIYKVPHRNFLILAAPNDLGHARLGLIFAKKNLRRAHDRNRVKRLVRESFRVRKQDFPGIDLVVLGRQGLIDIDNPGLFAILDKLWQRLNKAALSQSSLSAQKSS